jgi:8-oxo-dGTP diphosphatase
MPLPYKIATLLYAFNGSGEVLLLERSQEPNRGFWSPAGGKLDMDCGESPYDCACREAQEELGVAITPQDLHLTGLVSESGYQGQAHWLMFLFEIKRVMTSLPPPQREGRFQFFPPQVLETIKIPTTDREQIWPLFLRHRGGFFSAHCRCLGGDAHEWSLLEAFGSAGPEWRRRGAALGE